MKRSIILLILVLISFGSLAQYNWVPTGGTNGYVVDFAKASNGDLYATALINMNYKALLYKSTDNGATWTEITTVNYPREDLPQSITFAGSKMLIAGVSVSVSTDGGDVFTQCASGLATGFEPRELFTMPNGDVYLCGAQYFTDYEPRLYKSTNGGASWTQVSISGIPSPNIITDIIYINNKLVISTDAMGGPEGIFISSDGGSSWTQSSNAPAPGQFYRTTAFALGNAGELYVVGAHLSPGTLPLYVSTNQGQSWAPVSHNGLGNFFFSGGFIKSNGPFLMAGGEFIIFMSEYSVGLENLSKDERPSIYPNPAQNQLSLRFPDGDSKGEITFVDALGRAVLSQMCKDGTVDITMLTPGIYSVRLLSENAVGHSCKVIVER